MSGSVLVLNANYEPINVCGMRRAITLILLEKASLIENGRGEFHSATKSFPIPSVIRLQNMVHRPHPRVKLSRREIFRRDNYTCQYCGKQYGALTIDHIIPKHLGGTQSWTNMVTACALCNHQKGGRRLQDTNMHLIRKPQEPPSSALYIFGHHLPENETWSRYLEGW